MAYAYKMVQVPPNISIKKKDYAGGEAAFYLESLAAEQMGQGWEFYRVDTIGVEVRPGCLGVLFGQRRTLTDYYVVTFRRAQ